ncbi:peptidase M24, partial [Coprinopsis sp. MPI-PUGE-AT-0042]
MPTFFRSVISAVASLASWDLLSGTNVLQASWNKPEVYSHCSHVQPIAKGEFDTRQLALARALVKLGGDAYITESSGNSQYFGNFSVADWKLSERPLLLIVQPVGQDEHGRVTPQISILTPKFEHRRARLLPVPSYGNASVRYLDWAEDESPYHAALQGLGLSSDGTIFVDGGIRKFIADGLQDAAPQLRVLTAPPEITSLRQRKSPQELEIMKCANEAIILAIRDVYHNSLSIGDHESAVRSRLTTALSQHGVNGGCLTLFGPNAALPHGSGTDRVLGEGDFALFDCTAFLLGYAGDVTRTVALAESKIPEHHLSLWNLVAHAQTSALAVTRAAVQTWVPDAKAREVFKEAHLEEYFTHRLGHGIGLDGHEEPYLRGNTKDVIQTGHTFSNEPGLYIEEEVGIRIEDCFFIGSDGLPTYLTAGTGGPQLSPWEP